MPDPISSLTTDRRMTGVHAAAFRAFVAQLRADYDLARIVKTWVDYSGEPGAERIPDAPNLLPCIRLMPKAGPSERASITEARSTSLEITIAIAVAGTNADDSLGLWDAIESLIDDPAFHKAMHAYSVMDIDIVAPATTANDSGELYVVAEGRVRLDMLC